MPQVETAPGSKVIVFRPQALGLRRDGVLGDSERGRILLFTGVRYQRRDESQATEGEEDETQVEGDDDIFL